MFFNWNGNGVTHTSLLIDNRVFPKCFHWMRWIQWQKYYYFKKIAGLKPTISCVRNRDSTTVPHRHTANGLFILEDTENKNETETDNDNYGFHCNMQNTSHCTKTLPMMPLATFSHFIVLTTYIVLGVAQCEHTITEKTVKLILIHASVISQIPWIRWIQWKFCSI